MEMIINPVLRGFHPDPCICRAEGKYYMITSTFEWMPGISLYESEDLINWTSKGGILREPELYGIPDSAGIWAPALSYDNETFYLIYTVSKQIDGYFKDVENYVITAKSMDGPWSSPIFINASGFDPSMYHENGKHYMINPQWDSRPLPGHKKFNGLLLQEFDFEKGLVGESRMVFSGSGTGGTEGPHLLKKDAYYYIIAAEGGTGRHHSICVARSKSIWGPYEISPYHPLVTSWEKDTILKKSGHGNFVETKQGEWYMTHLCARYLEHKNVSVLGRETALQKLEWINGWPRMVQGECVPLVEVPAPAGSQRKVRAEDYRRDFKQLKNTRIEVGPEKFPDLEKEEWLTLRSSFEGKAEFVQEGLRLKGGDSLTSLFHQSLIARRWESLAFEAGTTVDFYPYHYSQTAGMVCYYNTRVFHYLYIGYDEREKKRIINILSNDNFRFSEPLKGEYIDLPEGAGSVRLKVWVNQEQLQFYYAADRDSFNKIGPVLDASILSDEHVDGWAYTGAMIGLTAVDNFNKDTSAVFSEFYQINEP